MSRLSKNSLPGGKQSSTDPIVQQTSPEQPRRLNRSKSIISLAQNFFKLRLNASSEETAAEPQNSSGPPNFWNSFASLRGSRSTIGSFSSLRERSVSPSKQSVDTGTDESTAAQLKHRKSLHNLFGTIGKRCSVRKSRSGMPNALGKRSMAESWVDIGDVPPVAQADSDKSPADSEMSQNVLFTVRKGEDAEQLPEDGGSRPCSPGSTCIKLAPAAPPNTPVNDVPEAWWEKKKGSLRVRFSEPVDSSETPSQITTVPIRTNDTGINFASASPAPSPEKFQPTEPVDYLGDISPERLASNQRRVSMDWKPTNISYVEVLSDSGNVPNVDLDPSFNTRAQLREDRYNKLLNQSSLDEVQTRLTHLHIQNSILGNAARMSENLHRGTLANGTEPQGNVLRSSWKENNTILGDMSTPSLSDMEIQSTVNEVDNLPNQLVSTNTTNTAACTTLDPYALGDMKGSPSDMESARTLAVEKTAQQMQREEQASDYKIPNAESGAQPTKRRWPRSNVRISSLGPWNIEFPPTEFKSGRVETHPSKAEAIGALFEINGEYSDYVISDPATNTLYPTPKTYNFQPENWPLKMECFWLPMQRAEFSDRSLDPELLNPMITDSPLNSTASEEIPSATLRRFSDTVSQAATPSDSSLFDSLFDDSLYDMHFDIPEGEKLTSDIANPGQSSAINGTKMIPQDLLTFQAEEIASFEAKHPLWREKDEDITAGALDAEHNAERIKTWSELAVEFYDKYAPRKDVDARCRGEEAISNFLRANGKSISDNGIVVEPKRRVWSRDRDESEDASFENIQELAEYERSRGVRWRRLTEDNLLDSAESSRNQTIVAPYPHAAIQECRRGSGDSGYATSQTAEKAPEQSQTSKSTQKMSSVVEKWVSPMADGQTVSPCASPAPSAEAELAKPSYLPRLNQKESEELKRVVRTCSFERFEVENGFNSSFYSSTSTKVAEAVPGGGYKTPHRAPLQEGTSNTQRPETSLHEGISNTKGRRIISESYLFSQAPTEIDEKFGEPLERYSREQQDEKEQEERWWRDFMLYG